MNERVTLLDIDHNGIMESTGIFFILELWIKNIGWTTVYMKALYIVMGENISNGECWILDQGRWFQIETACSQENGYNATLDVVGHTIVQCKRMPRYQKVIVRIAGSVNPF